MRISDWSSDVCSSDLAIPVAGSESAPAAVQSAPAAVQKMKDEAEDATIAPTETSEVRRLFRLQEAALPPAEEAVAEETAEPQPPTIVRAITVEPGDTLMQLLVSAGAARTQARSEERRGGKEGGSTWRSRWGPYN